MNSPAQAHTLADLPQIRFAQVVEVEGECDLCDRLRELGFTPGTKVQFERQAPFGGPLIMTLRGYQLALRPREARRVKIRAWPASEASR